jgi:nucleoside 2-deoxyribosyltransferase
LAGPTVRGNQQHLVSWRFEAIKFLEQKGFDGNVIVPEFNNKEESDQYRYDIPVWEFNGLTNSDVILFWVPRTRELIGLTTNHEHGYWMARDRSKVVYGRPSDAYRITYLDIMWVEDAKARSNKISQFSCKIHTTLEKTVDAALEKIKEI